MEPSPAPEPAVIWAALAYKAEVRMNRRRGNDTIWVREAVPVPVPVLSDAAAPVALRIERDVPMDRRGKVKAHREAVAMRWDGERLLRPLLAPDGKPLDVDGLGREMARVHAEAPVWPNNPILEYERLHDGRLIALNVFGMATREAHAQSVRHWMGDDRTERMAALVARAGDLAVVGGIVHAACPEPVIEVHTGWNQAASIGLDEPDPALDVVRFRIDRLDDAMALMERPRLAPALAGSIEVVVPEAVRRDALALNAPSLFGPASELLHELCGELSRGDVARAWADLRESEFAWRSGDAGAIHEGYAALRRAAAADWTRSPHSGSARYNLTPGPERLLPILEAYERFVRDRSLDEEVLAGFAPA